MKLIAILLVECLAAGNPLITWNVVNIILRFKIK